MNKCPCGHKMETKTSVRFGKEVDVKSCLCGREKHVIVYGPFDKATSGHEKFTLLANKL